MRDTRFDSRSSEWIGDMTVYRRETVEDNQLQPERLRRAAGNGGAGRAVYARSSTSMRARASATPFCSRRSLALRRSAYVTS